MASTKSSAKNKSLPIPPEILNDLDGILREKTRLDPKTGCHIWEGVLKGGNHKIPIITSYINGQVQHYSVRKIMYQKKLGPSDGNTRFLLSCDNHACVNWDHFIIVQTGQLWQFKDWKTPDRIGLAILYMRQRMEKAALAKYFREQHVSVGYIAHVWSGKSRWGKDVPRGYQLPLDMEKDLGNMYSSINRDAGNQPSKKK